MTEQYLTKEKYFGFQTEVSTSLSSEPCDRPCECTRAVRAPYTALICGIEYSINQEKADGGRGGIHAAL